MRSHIIAVTLLGALAAGGCVGDDEPLPGDPEFKRDSSLNVPNVSGKDDNRSHNFGENCMLCHQKFGPGKGIFTLAGTIYDAAGVRVVNPAIELYDGPHDKGGKLVMRVQGDALGNVFTTEELPFPNKSLFPLILSSDGNAVNHMPFPTLSGACNQCHRPDRRLQVLPKAVP